MKFFKIISAFIGLFSFASFGLADTGLAANTYRATQVSGSAEWQDSTAGQMQPLVSGQVLPEGAIISTGDVSSVRLVFANGATAIIGAKSQVVISKFKQDLFTDSADLTSGAEPSVSQTEIKLNRGTLSSRVSKLRSQSTYEVQTPVGVAGVRGTVFEVVYDSVNKILTVLTAEGKVVFSTIANQELPVDAGKNIIVYFNVDESGNIRVSSAETSNAALPKIKALLALFGLNVDDAGLLVPNLLTRQILSGDSP